MKRVGLIIIFCLPIFILLGFNFFFVSFEGIDVPTEYRQCKVQSDCTMVETMIEDEINCGYCMDYRAVSKVKRDQFYQELRQKCNVQHKTTTICDGTFNFMSPVAICAARLCRTVYVPLPLAYYLMKE